ncbi:hypothetical protein SFSGTM_23740 [Sulfuriferula nivalis]|uniref:Glycoside hydrolase family 19 catalytic domain-containing protein n=1 Tax=Sulfuriferula nivalis TaxID=2675298 RepID=A0A809RJ95_9PROT|nr:hypothetical protein SFSGTM_23740 [Sulfuriferula nivalis]
MFHVKLKAIKEILFQYAQTRWKFRGRGLKQVKGKYNYSEFTKGYKYIWSDGSDFIENPDLLAAIPHKVRSAVWFWVAKKNANGQHCWEIADEGDSPTTVNKITAIVNSGELGTADIAGGGAEARRKFFILTYSTFK